MTEGGCIYSKCLDKWSDGGTDDALVAMAGHVQELDEHISNGGDLPDGWARSSP